ncbi:MAG: hypothetical protein H7833_06805 [Magnetococcus sp. DMHC-1]|nr:hypothetical protein [Magnetococcales bacterium]
MKYFTKAVGYFLEIFLAILWLAGCQTVRYDMSPPSTEGGRTCVTQCAAIRETCRGNEIMRAGNEREACEHQAKQNLRSCLHSADSQEKKDKCAKKKVYCRSYENSDRCDFEYRTCYRQCGGTVIKIVE